MSTPAIILLLTNTGLSVYQADRKHAQLLVRLSPDTEGLLELRELARSWRHANFHLLTDLAEEDFQYESIPHLASPDRKALLARKLDQAWRGTPYRRVVIQTSGKQGGQDKLLLSALMVRERIDSIVDLLLAEKCAIAGIHSAALATDALVHRLKLPMPHVLLVNRSDPGSLRQSYFTQEGLRFSRLGGTSVESDVAGETRRARQYLTTLRQMNRDEALEVILLTDADETPAFAATFIQQLQPDAPQISASTETVASLAVQLGFPADCADWKMLLCMAIARGQIVDHYRPVAAGRYHRLRRLGHAISVGAAVIALAGVVMGWQGYDEAMRLQENIDQTQRLLRTETERKKDLDAKVKAITASQPASMKEAVDFYRNYILPWPDAEPAAQAVSRILSDFPLLVIDKFTWQAHTSAVLPANNQESATAPPAPVTPAAGGAAAPASESRRWQIIDLDGDITPFDGNYRTALDQVDQLIARLGKLPRTTITLSKAPLDIRPQGHIARQEVAPENASFAIRLVIAPQEGARP